MSFRFLQPSDPTIDIQFIDDLKDLKTSQLYINLTTEMGSISEGKHFWFAYKTNVSHISFLGRPKKKGKVITVLHSTHRLTGGCSLKDQLQTSWSVAFNAVVH